jgi:hypothetical protein
VKRTLHATVFNAIANDPEVRCWLGGDGPIDLADLLANPLNLAFLAEDEMGGFIYCWKAPGLYEVHTLSLPAGRGRALLTARNASLREMFTATDALEIVTMIPDGNSAAAHYAEHAGFGETFRRERCFDLMGQKVGASFQSLAYQTWALGDRGCRLDGIGFHEMIHRFVPDDHGEDPAHDAMVGATVECCAQNNAEKGLALYNRWALTAGYEPARVLTARPLVVDIGNAVVQISAGGLQVLRTRSARSALDPSLGEPICPSVSPQQLSA